MLISLLSETKCGELFRCALSFEQVDYPSSGLLETWHKQEMLAREKTGWLQSLLFSSISVKGQNLDSRPIISCPQLAVAIIPCLTILCEQTWTGNNKHVPHLIVGHCKTCVAIPDIIEDRCFHADKTVKSSVKTVHNLIKDRYAIEKPWYWCYWQIR